MIYLVHDGKAEETEEMLNRPIGHMERDNPHQITLYLPTNPADHRVHYFVLTQDEIDRIKAL